MKNKFLLLGILLSLHGFVVAQNDDWKVFLQDKPVQAMDFESDNIWVATDSFLIKFNKMNKGATYYPYPEIIEGGHCYLKIDNDGKKWLTINRYLLNPYHQLYRFDEKDWMNFNINMDGILLTKIEIDKSNRKWIIGSYFGYNCLYNFDGEDIVKITPENSELQFRFVDAVTADNNGNIWLGNTNDNVIDNPSTPVFALIKYNGENWTSYPGPPGYYSKIAFDKTGIIWIQTYRQIGQPSYPSRSVYFLDTTANSWINYLTLDQNYFLKAIEKNNKLWFSKSDQGMAVYNGSDWKNYTSLNSGLPSDTIYDIQIDSDGTKWIATQKGLVAFHENELNTSVEQDSKLNPEFNLFPNPARDYINVKLSSKLDGSTAQIEDIHGNLLKEIIVENVIKRFDISDLPDGVYIIKMQNENGAAIKKFIKL